VLDIGTRNLTGIPRSFSSLSIGATGSPVPCKSLIQVHAGFELGAAEAGLQVFAPTYPRITTTPGSDPTLLLRQFIDGSPSLALLDLTSRDHVPPFPRGCRVGPGSFTPSRSQIRT
jgi:hypothetical protein